MEFYTVVLRQSSGYWVALCLENGLVGQGLTQDAAIAKLKDAIASLEDLAPEVQNSPVSIPELREFLTVEAKEPTAEVYELRAVYA